MQVPTDTPVLVTGATGYVAGRVVERLLQEGLTVHATVRDASKTERLGYLESLAAGLPGTLRFFSADLMEPGSFADAMAGCGTVFHVASPFALATKDPQRDLVDPAVKGTRNVLTEADHTASVKRVVVTSSCAAIYTDNADVAEAPGGVLSEEVWNTSASLSYSPYSYSKTLAEREAWAVHEAQDRWELVVVNPCMVMGPGVRIHQGSESYNMLKSLGDGTMASGMPDLPMGFVDVRDLAEAHLRAAFIPEASGRYIICGGPSSFPAQARILRERFPGFAIPTRTLPKFLVWLVGPIVTEGLSRRFVSRSVGIPWKADNSKSRRELGLEYRPLEETLTDFFQQLVDAGEIKPK